MATEYKLYNICDVANWLNANSKIQLPVEQRGFVWKTSQIENLWDSLFRSYPIGSVMLARSGEDYFLMDGQQRTTAIALGFYNPWDGNTTKIGNVKNLPVIWIDLAPRNIPDSHIFVFRVVTRSHPWGYNVTQNKNVLSVSTRQKADNLFKDLYKQDVYTNLRPEQRIPYASTLPVPLSFLLHSVKTDSPKDTLIEMCTKFLDRGFTTYDLQATEQNYFELLKTTDFSDILCVAKSFIKTTKIPAIILPSELLLDPKDKASSDPTLFVRLNSQGTKIEGEDLIYSIYKATYPKAKELVDNIGTNLITPSRIVVLASRLVLSKDKYLSNLNLQQFRRYVQDETFLCDLENLIGTKEHSIIKDTLLYAIEILKYRDVPDVVVKKFIRESPNGLLLLLHWLLETGNDITEEKKKKICAKLYRNYWFGNMDVFVSTKWNDIHDADFWEADFHHPDYIYEHPLVEPNVLKDFLLTRLPYKQENHDISAEDIEIWNVWCKALPQKENWSEEDYRNKILECWRNFLWRLLGAKDKSLILLAQRKYINRRFQEFNQIEDLDDTNTPWDWDHIYPSSWVYYQQNIDDRTRRWEWRIGNFRAMPLTENRRENNTMSPAERFNKPDSDYFIRDNDLKYWSMLDHDHINVKAGNEEYVQIHAKAIIERSINIYENFLDMFFR